MYRQRQKQHKDRMFHRLSKENNTKTTQGNKLNTHIPHRPTSNSHPFCHAVFHRLIKTALFPSVGQDQHASLFLTTVEETPAKANPLNLLKDRSGDDPTRRAGRSITSISAPGTRRSSLKEAQITFSSSPWHLWFAIGMAAWSLRFLK